MLLLSTTVARGQDDDPATESFTKASRDLYKVMESRCPTKLKAAAAGLDQQFAALNDDQKKKVKYQLDNMKSEVDNFLGNWKADSVKQALGGFMAGVEGAKNYGADTYEAFDEAVTKVSDLLSDEINKKLLSADEVAAAQKKLESMKADFKKSRVAAAIAKWKEEEGSGSWESETQALPLEKIIENNTAQCGCEQSERHIRRARAWLEDAYVKRTIGHFPDAPELVELKAKVQKEHDQALANCKKVREQILAECEKLPWTQERDGMEAYFRQRSGASGLRRGKKKADDNEGEGGRREPLMGDEGLTDRMLALVKRWQEEKGKYLADIEALNKKLTDASNEAWPGLVSQMKPVPFEPTEALGKPDAWKGKVVKITGRDVAGGRYEAANFYIIVEMDGVPVCGAWDDGLTDLWKDFCAKTGKKKGSAYEECVAVVEGKCMVWERVKDPYDSSKIVRGHQIEAIKTRIVGVKMERWAAAVGHGSSLEKAGDISALVKGAGGEEGSSSSESSGAFHMVHRLGAWAMSGLLALFGLLAFLHGAAKYTPPLRDPMAKLGAGLGYTGIAFALFGLAWSFFAVVLPFLTSVRFGSAPAAVLVLTGGVLAMDLARVKGKIDEKTAGLIQTLAIFLGLACMGAAAVHVLFWDVPLL